MKSVSFRAAFSSALIFTFVFVGFGQTSSPASFSGKRLKRIVVRGAMVVDGSGKPAAGPFDIVIENDTITQIAGFDSVAAKEGKARRPGRRAILISTRAANTYCPD
ncbi:MAG: hypothetical protein HOP17_11240 [Acidobacteria bacterium]|nr:hypothetical protein [Acidobacteriota bacterium]